MVNNASEPVAATGALLHDSGWKVSRRVIGALLMRELLTRYGRNNIGFLWLFVEPMLFVMIITAVWAATRSIHGSNIPIVAFALTGYSSLLLWRGMAGRCIGAVRANTGLLYHRQVGIFDVYVARILLEFMAVSTSLVALGIAFYAMEWLPAPEDALKVLGGWLLLAWFGTGLGLTVGALSERYKVVQNLWPPLSYLLMPFSGVAFVASALPQNLREIMLWLPMLNALEIIREGWFGSLMHAYYDVPYLVVFNLLLTFAGLALVREVGVDTGDE